MDLITARKMHRTLEPYHGMIYFAPEAGEEYGRFDTEHGGTGYFASRAASMGAVNAGVVAATFFNFAPSFVHSAMQGAWSAATPEDWVSARQRAADRVLRRIVGDDVDSEAMSSAADLARTAAESCTTEGRPLAAGLLGLLWPKEPHLVLWHAISILREFRGDGHIAVLVEQQVSGCESLVLHAGTGEVPAAVLQSTRAWTDDGWAKAVASLLERGLVEPDGALTDSGQEFRAAIEERTDQLALSPWEALGEPGCDELRALVRPWSKTLVKSGVFGF